MTVIKINAITVPDDAGDCLDLIAICRPGAPDAGFEEEVSPDAQRRELAVKRLYRDGRTGLLAFRVEEHDGETWLVREAVLSGPREDLLKNDSARGRMAGTLAVDLLAWSRRI